MVSLHVAARRSALATLAQFLRSPCGERYLNDVLSSSNDTEELLISIRDSNTEHRTQTSEYKLYMSITEIDYCDYKILSSDNVSRWKKEEKNRGKKSDE
jgi:hypothetical protein